MKNLYKDYLFAKGWLVNDSDAPADAESTLAALAALATCFNIQVTKGHSLACLDMVHVASRNLGEFVPQPFYTGFPKSVRELSNVALLLDQLLHYTVSYGWGFFEEPGHSLVEEQFERTCLKETGEIRRYELLTEAEAVERLTENMQILLQSTRSLSKSQFDLLLSFIEDYHYTVTECACKDTVCRLLLYTRDASHASMLVLSDVIRLVEQMLERSYPEMSMRALNLCNQDRKFLTKVLNHIFLHGKCDWRACHEKKQVWNGLLHHLHYKPVNATAAKFVESIRGKANASVSAMFEKALAHGDIPEAVRVLTAVMGGAAIMRRLDYLLSRCKTQEDVDCVIEHMQGKNRIVLIQQLIHYSMYHAGDVLRIFKFAKFGKLIQHIESVEESVRRRSALSPEIVEMLKKGIRARLAKVCKNTLGKVYIGDDMKRVALPLQESTAMSGVGVLPRGSRVPIPEGKIIRGFTYWEKVNDIDLSCFGLTRDGEQIEFSWRSMYKRQSKAITYSGDQTRGYSGGSEYFDIDLEEFRALYPEVEFIVFCNNVFSRKPFNHCVCRAGYMVREDANAGEVFEPKTVASSYLIDGDSTYAYLFGIDLANREMIWLNLIWASCEWIAGETELKIVHSWLHLANIISVYDIAAMLATEVVTDPVEADVLFTDEPVELPADAKLIRSCDTEQIIALLNG